MGVGWDMNAISEAQGDVIAKLIPGGDLGLAHLSDDELHANTRRLVGKTNQVFATLLAHLAEVETRGIHRTRRCASLYTYCIYELRFSEDAAARRSAAARLVKEFPPLFDAVANGELHLTGLLMIGPHLTPENHVEVLGRAKFRTKKELGRLLRELNPLPQLPDCIGPIGPLPQQAPRNPTWEEYVTSLAPKVRALPIGERPCDWSNEVELADAPKLDATTEAGTVQGQTDLSESETLPVGPVPQELPPVTGPQQYLVQFSTVEAHAHLVERAKALLTRSRPSVTLGELHLEAMQLLVASLEKRRFAVTDRPRTCTKGPQDGEPASANRQEPPTTRQRGDQTREAHGTTRQRGSQRRETGEMMSERAETEARPRKRSRYIPASERRSIYQRDAGRCTYVDARGQRCCETRYLELHHLQPFAKHGASVAANVTLRCAAHNALAAEEDFGALRMAKRRDATLHEALAAQSTSAPLHRRKRATRRTARAEAE